MEPDPPVMVEKRGPRESVNVRMTLLRDEEMVSVWVREVTSVASSGA